MPQIPTSMGDKEILTDSLSSQKMITETYNTFCNECASPQLRQDFFNILKEEHDIQADLFYEMQSRGWYQTKPAQPQDVSAANSKFK
ncbi:MAG: spore coat protein [Clostridiales bacterium]|jgi:spore coat protein CotF|nr:spore coat protein [Clostridiales bacterium]